MDTGIQLLLKKLREERRVITEGGFETTPEAVIDKIVVQLEAILSGEFVAGCAIVSGDALENVPGSPDTSAESSENDQAEDTKVPSVSGDPSELSTLESLAPETSQTNEQVKAEATEGDSETTPEPTDMSDTTTSLSKTPEEDSEASAEALKTINDSETAEPQPTTTKETISDLQPTSEPAEISEPTETGIAEHKTEVARVEAKELVVAKSSSESSSFSVEIEATEAHIKEIAVKNEPEPPPFEAKQAVEKITEEEIDPPESDESKREQEAEQEQRHDQEPTKLEETSNDSPPETTEEPTQAVEEPQESGEDSAESAKEQREDEKEEISEIPEFASRVNETETSESSTETSELPLTPKRPRLKKPFGNQPVFPQKSVDRKPSSDVPKRSTDASNKKNKKRSSDAMRKYENTPLSPRPRKEKKREKKNEDEDEKKEEKPIDDQAEDIVEEEESKFTSEQPQQEEEQDEYGLIRSLSSMMKRYVSSSSESGSEDSDRSYEESKGSEEKNQRVPTWAKAPNSQDKTFSGSDTSNLQKPCSIANSKCIGVPREAMEIREPAMFLFPELKEKKDEPIFLCVTHFQAASGSCCDGFIRLYKGASEQQSADKDALFLCDYHLNMVNPEWPYKPTKRPKLPPKRPGTPNTNLPPQSPDVLLRESPATPLPSIVSSPLVNPRFSKKLPPKPPLKATSTPVIKVDDPDVVGISQASPATPPPKPPKHIEASFVFKKKLQEKRKFTAQEILSTEKNYHEGLQTIYQVFYLPMKESGVVTAEQLEIILSASSMKAIMALSDKLVTELEDHMAKYEQGEQKHLMLGSIFFSIAKYLRLYTNFVNSYDESRSLVLSLMKEDKQFSQWMKEKEKDERCNKHTFEDLLISIIQRLPQYIMLLGDLAKVTPVGHPDYDGTSKALSKLKEVADFINSEKKKHEGRQRAMELWKEWRLPDANEDRMRLHEATKAEKLAFKRTWKLVFFTDMMVLATYRPDGCEGAKKFMLSTTIQLPGVDSSADAQKLRFANNTYYVENLRTMKVLREILTNILALDVESLDAPSSKKSSKTPRILKF